MGQLIPSGNYLFSSFPAVRRLMWSQKLREFGGNPFNLVAKKKSWDQPGPFCGVTSRNRARSFENGPKQKKKKKNNASGGMQGFPPGCASSPDGHLSESSPFVFTQNKPQAQVSGPFWLYSARACVVFGTTTHYPWLLYYWVSHCKFCTWRIVYFF